MNDEETDEWRTFTVKMRPEMIRQLDARARKLGVSRIALVRFILQDHIDKTN